jgi:microcin C transport system substrate-binding protein
VCSARPTWRLAPTSGPSGLRRNLLKASELLAQAGWKLDGAGVLRNAKGEAFEFEYLQPQASSNVDWQRNLKKLGITMKDRVVDFALYTAPPAGLRLRHGAPSPKAPSRCRMWP